MNDEKKSWLDRAGAVHLWKTIEAMLGTKVDKIEGFGLSSNDYTTEEKEKLATLADPDVATTENNGLMSSADKAKLDGIEAGANNYTHPAYEAKQAGLYRISVDNTGHVATADKMTSEELAAEGVSPADHTHDLSELADTLAASADAVEDADTVMVGATVTSNGSATTKYTRKPLAALWNWIKSKADTLYAAVGHNHKVNELENYDTHVYNPTLNRTKRTVLAAPTAADGPATFRALDKNDVGLGNVDNVAALPLTGGTMSGQIKRSINTSHITARDGVPLSNPQTGTSYRPVVGVKSANGYWVMSTYNNDNLRFAYTSDADYSAGTNRETTVLLPSEEGTIITSASIGNQVVAGVKDCNSGTTSTFAYSKSGMNYGDYSQLAAWNGYELRAVSKDQFLKADGKAVSAGTADYASQTQIDRGQTVDLSSLDANTQYPVVTNCGYPGLHHIKCNVQLSSGTKPSWSTHSSGFTAVVELLTLSPGWGTTGGHCICLCNDQRFISDSSKPPVGYTLMWNGSMCVFWLRGGGRYNLYADYETTQHLQTSSYTNNEQTVSPTTSYPGISCNFSTQSSSYPVGSIYMSTDSTSPASIFGGSWQSIASERVLMGVSSSHGAGSTVDAGLPNISSGSDAALDIQGSWGAPACRAPFAQTWRGNSELSTSTWSSTPKIISARFDASLCNSIYGRSSTVQPAAYYVYMWRRTG